MELFGLVFRVYFVWISEEYFEEVLFTTHRFVLCAVLEVFLVYEHGWPLGLSLERERKSDRK